MEDLFLAIAAGILQLLIALLWAARRPLRYLLSAEYRAQLNSEWADRSRISLYSHVFGGAILLILGTGIIVYVAFQ